MDSQKCKRHLRVSALIAMLMAAVMVVLGGCGSTRTAEESTLVTADPEKPYAQIVDRFNNNRQLIEESFLDGEDNLINN